MESIKPITYIRYILLFSSLTVMFVNLFDCIRDNDPVMSYILYVGTFLVIAILLMFFDSSFLIVWIIYGVASITMLSQAMVNQLSYAIILYCLAIFIKRDIYIRVACYFTTFIITVCVNVFTYKSPADLLNVLIAYTAIYIVAELTYKHIKES